MGSLFGSLSIALSSMYAQQDALAVTANNVSNINTPGYSRQRAELQESDAVFNGRHMVGMGVQLEQITSLRDRVLELRIQGEQQEQGSLQSQVDSLQDIQTLFSSDTRNIGDSMNALFASISQLSTNAASVPLRQSVLLSAQNLSRVFQTTATTLQQRQFNLDLNIQQTAEQVNEIAAQIAEINGKISITTPLSTEQGAFEDKRSQLMEQLSGLIGNQAFLADDGLTVTTGDGTPLVLGSNAVPLTISRQADGSVRLSSEGVDITDSIKDGKIGGLIAVRGKTIPDLLSKLDTLAGNIATAVNNVQLAGTDLNGNPGANFFVPPPGGNIGAAAAMQVSISDPASIAGSLDGSAGDNSNLNQMLALQSTGFVGGDTPSNYYAKIAFTLGSQVSAATDELDASQTVLQQLNDQRGALSGVSLDEEAANLTRYQRAYEAAARVLNVIDELTQVSVNLGNQ
jgi:flagellar hook-associated protein 1 FlgK